MRHDARDDETHRVSRDDVCCVHTAHGADVYHVHEGLMLRKAFDKLFPNRNRQIPELLYVAAAILLIVLTFMRDR